MTEITPRMHPELCYVSQFGLNDSSALSGTNLTVYEALKLHTPLHHVAALRQAPSRRYQFQNLINSKIGLISRSLPYHTWSNIRQLASGLKNYSEVISSSYLFCPSAIIAAACIYANYPEKENRIYMYSDATVKSLHGYYPEWSRISKSSLMEALEVESYVYSRCTGIIMASEWAADSLTADYKVNASKVFVVPRAANIPQKPRALTTEEIECRRRTKDIVIVAKNWKRKGIDIALKAVEELRLRGINSSLTIIGVNPPNHIVSVPPFVRLYPFIDKNTPEGWNLFSSVMHQAAIFIFPTQAEAMGIALTEACAFSLPIVAANTGGVSAVVENNVNGILLNSSASHHEYTDALQKILSSNATYEKMTYSARQKYLCHHTTEAVGRALLNIVYGDLSE